MKKRQLVQLNLHGQPTSSSSSTMSNLSQQGGRVDTRYSSFRFRNACFTAYVDPRLNWDLTKIEYVIMQEEICPSTGRRHWQGYAELDKAYTMRTMKLKIFRDNSIHIESRMGTQEEAINYCKKMDTRAPGTDVFTYGSPKQQGERTDIQEYAQFIRNNVTGGNGWNMDDVERYGHMMIKFPGGTKALTETVLQASSGSGHREVTVTVIYGDTGTGKTTYLYRQYDYKDVYVVPLGKNIWFPNYRNQDVLFFDEFNGEASGYPIEFFLKVCDSYPLKAENKGGFVDLVHTKVVVCSNVHPSKWWSNINERQYEALMRRLITGGPIQHWLADKTEEEMKIPEVTVRRTKEDIKNDRKLMQDRINKPLEFPSSTSVQVDSGSPIALMAPPQAQVPPWQTSLQDINITPEPVPACPPEPEIEQKDPFGPKAPKNVQKSRKNVQKSKLRGRMNTAYYETVDSWDPPLGQTPADDGEKKMYKSCYRGNTIPDSNSCTEVEGQFHASWQNQQGYSQRSSSSIEI